MELMDGICARKENRNLQRRKLRVVHLLSGREGGGITTVVSSLIQYADPDSLEASILLLAPNPKLARRSEEFKCHLIRKRFPGSPIAVFRIIAYCLRFHIDILHTHGISSNFYGRTAGIFMTRTAVVTTVHARTYDELRGAFRNKMLAWYIHKIDLWMHRLSARIIAVSDFLRRELIANGVPEGKIFAVPHGILPSSADVAVKEVEAVRRNLNVGSNKKIVGIVGRLTPVKNHELFIRACKEVAAKHPELVVLIVGDGSLRNHLEALAEDLSISAITIFTGWVDAIYPILHLLDVQVISSLSEGFGYILLEGMACKRAIVATAISEIPRILEDRRTGLLVPPNDIGALANAIDYLLRNPRKRNEMGELARKEVTKRFGIEREVERTREVYVHALGIC